jgi:hypothetical protein
MQSMYNYLPETKHVSRSYLYSVEAILYLQFILQIMLFFLSIVLYFYINTSRSKCAMPNMAGFCSCIIVIVVFLQNNTLFTSAKGSDRFWSPPNLPQNGYQCFYPRR